MPAGPLGRHRAARRTRPSHCPESTGITRRAGALKRLLRDGRAPALQSLRAMADSGGPRPPAADWTGHRQLRHRLAVGARCTIGAPSRRFMLVRVASASLVLHRLPVGLAVLPAPHSAALCGSRPAVSTLRGCLVAADLRSHPGITNARKCATILGMRADQGEPVAKRGRGRPRKWPSETARREHEAAKRRLRNKLNLAAEEFDGVRRLTALADDLQRQVVELTEEVEALRCRERELEQRLARAARVAGSAPSPTSARRPSPPLPRMSRQQRRALERAQRRSGSQPRDGTVPRLREDR